MFIRWLKDWLYTLDILLHPAFAAELKRIEREVEEDESPGTPWREVYGPPKEDAVGRDTVS